MHGRAISAVSMRLAWRSAASRRFTGSGGLRVEFGKHRGMTFEECFREHPDYGEWLLRQPESPKTTGFRNYIATNKASTSKSHTSAPPAKLEQSAQWSAAGQAVVTFGKYKGKSFEEVSQLDPKYCQWVVESSQKPDAKDFTKVFAAYLQQGSSDVPKPAPPVQNSPRAAPSGGSSSSGGTISFGKHKGKSFEEVCQTDVPYGQWMVKQSKEPDASANAQAFAAFVQDRFPDLLTTPSGKPSGSPAFSKSWNKPSYPKPPYPKPVEVDDNSVSSGLKRLGGGKHAESTYAEVFESEPRYCKFVVEHGLSEAGTKAWYWPFIAYVQQRWLLDRALPPQTFKCTGKKGCLEGASYAVSGTPAEMSRLALEELISFFGGRVASAVSSKTSYLVVAGKGMDGRAAEEGAKYRKAEQHNIPKISVEDFLKKHIQDGRETFESHGHTRGEVA